MGLQWTAIRSSRFQIHLLCFSKIYRKCYDNFMEFISSITAFAFNSGSCRNDKIEFNGKRIERNKNKLQSSLDRDNHVSCLTSCVCVRQHFDCSSLFCQRKRQQIWEKSENNIFIVVRLGCCSTFRAKIVFFRGNPIEF